jgi:hypothetical protein
MLGLALLAAPLAAAAQSSSSDAPESVTKRLDPTDFKSRVETRYEYQSLQNGGTRQLLVPRYEHAFSKALSLRFDVPYVAYGPPTPGSGDERGLGDVMIRPAWRALRGEGYGLVLAAEIYFDTASEPHLGTGKNVVAPLGFISLDAPRLSSVVFPFVQQFVSVSGDADRADINTTLLRLGVLSRWPNRFYTFLEPSLYIDWKRDADTGFTLELEIGRLLNRQLAIWARPGVGVWGDDFPLTYNWNFEVGFRYFLD